MRTLSLPLPAVAALALLALAPFARPAGAQTGHGPQLPARCDAGELLVAGSFGRFECRSPSRALALAGCDAGDFVVAGHSGELRCERPANASRGVRGLLPECSAGEVLVSEGFGRWRCVDSPLPRCASGETLVSEGSGRWRCAPPAR
ncbi:MAG: hypothetical protein U0325_15120 [Polyangiales bacterium]